MTSPESTNPRATLTKRRNPDLNPPLTSSHAPHPHVVRGLSGTIAKVIDLDTGTEDNGAFAHDLADFM